VDIDTEYKNICKPNSFSISPNTEQTVLVRIDIENGLNGYFNYSWKRTDTNNQSGVKRVPSYMDVIFKNE